MEWSCFESVALPSAAPKGSGPALYQKPPSIHRPLFSALIKTRPIASPTYRYQGEGDQGYIKLIETFQEFLRFSQRCF